MVANFVVLAGQLLMPGLAALCRDWQVLQAVIICPLVLMLSYIWIFPESLRWLLSTQQYCRAKRQMFRIAKKNKVGETDADEVFAVAVSNSLFMSKPKKTCIVKMVGTRTLWKNIVVLCVNSLTGYGIHHCFARSMIDPEAGATTMFQSFYTDYFMMAGIAVASCMALAGEIQHAAEHRYKQSETLNKKFSIAFSIIGMFSSHAVSNLSIFFCAEITPTVISSGITGERPHLLPPGGFWSQTSGRCLIVLTLGLSLCRGGGLGLVLASAGFGMLTAPIMELHDQKGYFLHHIIFACCTLICIICILLLPETRYQPLPETIGDGEAYTRQPLLPPKKPGEQDPLLTKLDPAGGQETALGGADNPPSAGDVNAAPPCGVEDEVPCIVIPPPCTMDDAAAEPIALDTIIPTAADSISLCATPPATDTTDSKTTDTESPTAAEASPPGITDSALPIAADAIPPYTTDPRIPDTSPSADKDDAPVHATDAAQPTTVDSISGSNDGTPPAGATDATPPAAPPLCTIDAVAPPPPDTEPTANSKAPCSMDVSPTGPAPSPSSVPANDAPPSPTDSVSPTTTDPDRAIPVNGTAS
ncbi:hypothetical protein JZ751_010282, partial [Albula glossodonta]